MILTIFDLISIFIIFTSFGGIVSLISQHFMALPSLFLGLLATSMAVLYAYRKKSFSINVKRLLILLPIIFFALIFRSDPYLYIMGGQDEGTYINMSATYNRDGRTIIKDNVRKNIKNLELLSLYDQANQKGFVGIKKVANNIPGIIPKMSEGAHIPGIYIKDSRPSASKYVFQFYSLYPIWLAIGAKIFGPENRVWIQVVFSLLSIAFMYLLVFELTNNEKAAVCSAILLATNVLHIYFSKFSVTEVTALTFSLAGFYYLTKFYNLSRKHQTGFFYLLLSSSLFWCYFMTRISAFLYLPFFALILLFSIVFIQQTKSAKQYLKYSLLTIALYFLSVIYGLAFSFPYAFDIYSHVLTRIFPSHFTFKHLAACFAVMTLSFSVIFIAGKTNKKLSKYLSSNKKFLISLSNKTFLFFVYILILLSIYTVYKMMYSTPTNINEALLRNYPRANMGLKSLPFTSAHIIYQLFNVAGLIICAIGIHKYRKYITDLRATFLYCFTCLALIYNGLMQYLIPYQYYYSRYLMVQTIPIIIIFISFILGRLYEGSKNED
ncbi:MAG: hypothetical protein ACE365_02220 [Gammaproteobacteria bacterium]